MDTQINEAYDIANNFSFKDAEMYQYLNREMAIRDYNTNIQSSRQEGILIGRAEGIDIGRAEGLLIGEQKGIGIGRAEGIGIGAERKNLEFAQKMLQHNQPIPFITELTGYTKDQLLDIAAKL